MNHKQFLTRWSGAVGLLATIVLTLGLVSCGNAQAPALGNDVVASISPATRGGSYKMPLDSTPDPDGNTIYFTATGSKGKGIFRVPASGGEAVEVATGKPFVAPRGISIGTDGRQIYVADSQAAGPNGKVGQVFVTLVNGGAPTPLRGTEGTAPLNITIVKEESADVIYFTGKDPSDGQPAVLKITAAGSNAPTVVVKGSPFVAPDGIAATKTGILYVTDRAAAGNNLGSVFRVAGTAVTKIADNVRLGDPASAALTLDDSVLLVSAIDRNKGTDQVLLIDLASLQTGLVTKVVEANHEDAGGVHRAYNRNSFSWANSSSDGAVYHVPGSK